MSDVDEAWVEKAKIAVLDAYLAGDYARSHGITEVGEVHHAYAETYARAVLAAVLPDVRRAAVDRDAAIRVLVEPWDSVNNRPDYGARNARGPITSNRGIAEDAVDRLIASGVVRDAADVRRAVAEEIAAAIERHAGMQTYALAVGLNDAARIARAAARDDVPQEARP